MKKSNNDNFLDAYITTILLGLLIYSSYSLWYIFGGFANDFNVQLYNVISGIALGWFVLLFIKTVFKNANFIAKLISFLAGNALFHGLIWGINANVNILHNEEYLLNETVTVKTFTIVFALSGILLLISFIIKAKNKFKILK